MSDNSAKKRELHFVTGLGRSGTTLLNKLLIGHPQIHCLPEANFLVFFLHAFKNKTFFSASEIDLVFEQIKIYSLSHPLIGWSFDPQKAKAEVLKRAVGKQPLSYAELCELIYLHFEIPGARSESAEMLIDKNPSYTIFTDKIGTNFPDAKFIWLVRDYRANVLSRKQNVDLKSSEISFNSMRWKLFNSFAYHFYKKNKERVLLVKYEDLVTDPELTMKKVYDFLNVNVRAVSNEEIFVDGVGSIEFLPEHKDRLLKKYNDLNKPVNTERLFSWKTELTPEEIETSDVICSRFATVFGYESVSSVSGLKKMRIRFSALPQVISAYLDLYKDRLIYYAPVKMKLKRLKKKYLKLGFYKK